MPVNSGLPAVRRRGIELATGDYILHCDSDDWMDCNMISEMWHRAVDENLDVVICDFCEVSDDDKTCFRGVGADISTIYIDIFKSAYSWALWNKLIKHSVYENPIIYPRENIGEDMALTLQLLYFGRRIGHLGKPLYYYYKNPSSMTKPRTIDHIKKNALQWKENVCIVDVFFKDRHNKHILDCLTFLKYKVKNALLPLLYNKAYLRLWRETFSEINFRVYLNPYISKRAKIYFLLVYLGICPNHFNIFRKNK